MKKSLADMQELGLGILLKRLTERLYATMDQVYRDSGLPFQASWFAPLVTLAAQGSQSITELAAGIGLSHPAVNHLSKQLLEAGLVQESTDSSDRRRRLLSLTPAGEQMLEQLRPIWAGVQETTQSYFDHAGYDVFAVLKAYEKTLEEGDLLADTLTAINRHQRAAVDIIDYQPAYAEDFYRLNVEWLTKYFFVEARDEEILSAPQREIIEPGGVILFARYQDNIVGTCALLKIAEDHFELAKMAVTENHQGLGIGRRLLDAAIQRFHELKGRQLQLETNRKLHTAIGLYSSAGFVPVEPPSGEKTYQRADFFMVYQLGKTLPMRT